MATKTQKVVLNYGQKKELKEIFGYYKSANDSGNRYSIEEKNKIRAEARKDYETKFPELSKKVDLMGDQLPKLIYSVNQVKFINDAEEQGLDIYFDYSGRGMMGVQCPAVNLDAPNDIATKAKVRVDGMGKGVVVYAEY